MSRQTLLRLAKNARRCLLANRCSVVSHQSGALADQACCSTSAPSWAQQCTRSFAGEAAGSGPSRMGGPVSYASLALTLGTGAGILWYFNHERERKLAEIHSKQESVGVAAIGGPFDLLDQDGKRFTHEDLRGNYSLLYFGFTHCPDICPDELEKLATAIDAVEKQTGHKVLPVFITVDPERDSVPKVKAYVKQFHPRLIGLTGPHDKVKAAAKAYRVYYSKTNDDPKDYLVDHSIIMYLLDPDGQFMSFYGKNYTAEELAGNISGVISKQKGKM
ncbi:Protein SCO1 homolog, mitochondrial [Coccomyxa sp. Obi]|nr:Protein SCO1 homolog, mitochondrial [Coccomyxa sp. Obi]